jgi:hypothetical protein
MPGSQRPFWMHQLVEYVLGLALISVGARSPTPVLPCVLGALIMLNAAITRGPLSAFRGVPRGVHRTVDVVLVGLAVVLALQPVIDIDSTGRMLIALVAGALAFVWWHSSFAEKPPKAVPGAQRAGAGDRGGDRSSEIGRTAGRMVGEGVNAVRRRTRH